MNDIRVELAERSYNINFGKTLPVLAPRKTLLVTDSNIYKLYADLLKEMVKPADIFVIPAGEESKNADTFLAICRKAAELHLGRDCRFAAAGGGVTGDLTGFAASCYLRGVPFIQIPTSLLAMVDSSVGGKTGIDIPEGKNLIGAFHQPESVTVNTAFLATLPDRELANGLAEVVKTAAIADEKFFSFLEDNAKHLYDRGKTAIFDEIVRRCCEIKAHVVSCDEKESGLRAILNYGHTFAHPVETLSSYRISHGEAVSIGMECAGLLALELGMWSKEQYLRQAALLDALHLPRRLPENTDIDSVIELMKSDKKNRNGKITFVLPVSTGSVKVVSDIPVELIRKVISEN